MAFYLYRKMKKRAKDKEQPQGYAQELEPNNESPTRLKETSAEESTPSADPTTAINKEAEQRAKVYRRKLIFGLVLPFTVQALDLTVIAPASIFIASDFNQLAQLNWIISAYNLCNAAFIPLWAQLADTFGRYTALQTASLTGVIGATLCASAPVTAFPMLVVGRALQGAGCAGLLIITKIILADKVSLKENARNNSIFSFVGGIGYGVGPTVGGYLTEASWRYCFILVIPIGVLGMFATHFLLRTELLGPQEIGQSDTDAIPAVRPSWKDRFSTLDFGGQILFLLGAGLLVLALTWAGSYYPWSSRKVIVPLTLSLVLLVCFFAWEYFLSFDHFLARRFPRQKPMIPLDLFISRNCGTLMYVNFSTGMAMYAVFYFSSLYLVLVASLGPGEAGRNLIYYVPGLAVGVYTAMFVCNIWPLQTWFPLFLGTVIEPLGITLLAIAMSKRHLPWVYGMLGLTGFGTGIRFMPGTLHGVGYHRSKISSIVSLMALSQSFGGTVATTTMLNIFNNYLSKRRLPFSLANGGASSTSVLKVISNLSPEEQMHFKSVARDGIVLAFLAITAFMWIALVSIAFLGNVRISKTATKEDQLAEGSYVMTWFRSSTKNKSKA